MPVAEGLGGTGGAAERLWLRAWTGQAEQRTGLPECKRRRAALECRKCPVHAPERPRRGSPDLQSQHKGLWEAILPRRRAATNPAITAIMDATKACPYGCRNEKPIFP